MTGDEASLAGARRRIDEIDDAIHDLLMRRAATAAEIRRAKGAGPAWRPAREAQVLRRLLSRHEGPFPGSAVARIWREIMSAMVRLQGDFKVAVPDGLCRDAAREWFGADTALSLHESPRTALAAVRDGAAAVGVLPAPEDGEASPWWTVLADMRKDRPAVCAALPFASPGSAALCVASLAPEESGDDRTLVAVPADLGEEELDAAAAKAGTGLRRMIRPRSGGLLLAELEGFVGDASLSRFVERAAGAVRLGAYPAPVRTGVDR